MITKFHTVMKKMEQKGFKVEEFDTAEGARNAIILLIGRGSVGFGGSMTLESMGIYDQLKSAGNHVFWHWKEDENAREKSLATDFYITSTNAITSNGQLVNIDGRGNRVATMILAKHLIVVIGKNKLVEGGIEEAILRIKQSACGQNARRLGANVPCKDTFTCVDCDSPTRICRVISVIDRPMIGGQKIHIFFVNQDLGY